MVTGTIGLALLGIFVVGIAQGYSNDRQWARGRHVKAWYAAKVPARVCPTDTEEAAQTLLWPVGQVETAREILQRYSLSSFSERSLADYAAYTGIDTCRP